MIERIKRMILRELIEKYPDADYFDRTDLTESLKDIYTAYHRPFVFIIDEWDCRIMFRLIQEASPTI